MFKKCALILFCISSLYSEAQLDSIPFKNGIIKPNILTTHHFGIFSSRIEQNFKRQVPDKTLLSFTYSSGNSFHPFVEAYFPKDPEVRHELSQVIWHDRNFNFVDQETTPADYMNVVIDAVIKEFRFNANFALSLKHEFKIGFRSYLITKGKYPFSFFSSDESIEWFHSNIAGGEDPYGRRYYGLNQVNFNYNDRNGNNLSLEQNDFFLSGIEFSHYYYPESSKASARNIFFNIGSHLGINTSKYNPSADIGISVNGLKNYTFKSKNQFNIGVGFSFLRKNIVDFKEDVVDLGTNKFLATLETDLEFTKFTEKNNFHSFSVNYHIQSRYNKRKEADYYKLLGKWQEINGGWQHGVETLYKALSDWTFIYTYARPKFRVSIYFKEDLLVNNAPDFQTGIGFEVPLNK